MQWVLKGGRVLRGVLTRGSKKELLRTHIEGRNTPFRRVRPPWRAPSFLGSATAIVIANRRSRAISVH